MNAILLPDSDPLQLCSAAIEVTPVPPERLLAMSSEPAAAFIAPGGQAWVGLGAARWLTTGSCDASPLWASLIDESPEAPSPMALGALPFSTDELPDALWQGLAPGGVMLPERLYVQQGGRAWWRITLPLEAAQGLAARLLRERAALARLAPTEAQALPALHALGEGGAPAHYVDAVTQAVERIRRGDLVKVVLARRGAFAFDELPSPAALLARLGDRHPDCIRYAWRNAGKIWLGATPETLVRVDGQTLHTVALAGTRSAERAAELPGSAKDRHEHAVVADALRRAIAPFTQALPAPLEPTIRHLHGLAHLHTPIEATLRAGVDFLHLVQTLHPTPAVCGLPTEQAGALLGALEPEPRGLYAGPFLRLSPGGDGHAVVALRGAVIDGRLAVLPAGAGIVAGSDGESELAETRVKQHSVLAAFQGRP